MNDEETKRILKEILKWQRVQGLKTLKELIPSLLDTDRKKIVYEMTGNTNRRQITEKLHISSATLTDWWKEWHSYGLLIREERQYKKIISLKKLGIKIPSLDQETVEKDDRQETNE